MDSYGVYKEFGEVMKTTKYTNLPDVEKKYKSDGQTKVDLNILKKRRKLSSRTGWP